MTSAARRTSLEGTGGGQIDESAGRVSLMKREGSVEGRGIPREDEQSVGGIHHGSEGYNGLPGPESFGVSMIPADMREAHLASSPAAGVMSGVTTS